MTPHDLIAAFEALGEAPDGAARLRELILQLAVRGRLVRQDPAEQPGLALLASIPAEKDRLAKSGLIRKVDLYPALQESSLGFDLPRGWAVAPLGNVTLVLDHLREPVKSEDREARCAGKPPKALYPYFGATQQQGWIDDYRLDGEFVLLGEDGVPFLDPLRNKAYMVSGRVWVNNHAHVLLGVSYSNHFLLHYLNQFDFAGRVTGTTRAKLTKGDLIDIPVPVPPLAEQHRIVARVDELMGLLDRLEAARTTRETTRAAVRDSALDALRQADTPEEVDVAWNRFAQRMDDLVCDPADIAPLRQTVLQLAVRGRLVRQDPKDEPASVLLQRIAAEKARLVKARNKGKQDLLPPVTEEDAPFELPGGWVWDRLGQISLRIHYGYTAPSDARLKAPLLLRITDIQNNRVDWDSVPGCEIEAADFPKFALQDGDIVIARTGGTVGKTYLVADLGKRKAVFASYLIRVESVGCMDADYLKRSLESPLYWWQLMDKAAGTGQPNVGASALSTLVLPIPPLAEQRRIVARVDELMGLLDRLEARLTAARTVHSAFAAAAVHHLDA